MSRSVDLSKNNIDNSTVRAYGLNAAFILELEQILFPQTTMLLCSSN